MRESEPEAVGGERGGSRVWLSRASKAGNDNGTGAAAKDSRSILADAPGPSKQAGERLLGRFRMISRAAAVLAGIAGAVTLAGWVMGIEWLESVLPGRSAMRPNAALAFLFCGLALWCLKPAAGRGRRRLGQACALTAALIGLVTLCEYVFRVNFGIDLLLAPSASQSPWYFAPGRMPPVAAPCFLLLGTALLLVNWQSRRGFRPSEWLSFPVAVISSMALLEHLFGFLSYLGIGLLTYLPLASAIVFAVLCAGVLCARPDRGLMAVATAVTEGGRIWRRLLPVAVVVPAAVSWLRLEGQRAGYYGLEIGLDLMAVSMMVVLIAVVWVYAKSLDRSDRQRRRNEEQLHAASQYARNLIETSLDPLVTISQEGKITDVNRATEAVTGRSRDELIGTDFSDYFTEPEQARAGYRQAFQQGAVRDYPLALRHRSGRVTEVLYNAAVYKNPAGAVEGVFAAARDVTARKEAEDRLRVASLYARNLIEASLDPLVTISQEGKITDVNRATEEVTGRSRGELIGTDFSDYFTEPEQARAGYRQAFQQGAVRDYPLALRHRKGWLTDVLYNAAVYKSAVGTVEGVFAAARDVTALKKAEDELRRSNQDLEQFAYAASHDLQEPLRMVASYTQLLAERYQGKLDADADDFIGFAVDGAKRMQRLIEDLLALSRVGTRGREAALCAAGTLVADALKSVEASVAESGARVEVGELPEIRGDAVQLEAVFQNLIANAIKFRDKVRPCVIRVSARRQGGDWVFSVEDNGIGIESRHFERIFQVFQRLHTREEYPGTGIGLAISKKIVERHHGRIWVESRPGAGSSFRFSVPAEAAKEEAHAISAVGSH